MTHAQIFSIGHSNHSIDKFLSLLESSDINMVVDVRSAPFSRMFPQFNQETLKKSLSDASIGYLFLGDQIGGRSNDPDDYLDGQVIYKALANKEAFKTGIERLKEGSAKYRIALMCSEKEPLDCHRTLLVSQALANSDIVVGHIHADGTVEAHEDALVRLLSLHNLSSPDLFSDDTGRVQEALTLQEKKIAYQIPKPTESREEFE
jgi:uncharacterized protein (DUF488 family)